MTLAAGARLGPYEVIAPLGAGGMGEVYRARDTKLQRDVALKVLPGDFSDAVERIARFEREARLLAALNHPHIAQIYGFEESGEVTALVMELVEGPTLAERLAHGPLAVTEALAIARQILAALDAAHEHGIIHRDLKPANIKVTDDGTVKVLDFGLAKALSAESTGMSTNPSASPTITSPAMTAAGVILGTAAYMAPEQARGKPVDKRADIWAFGCVLYEMFTGRRAFEAEDVSMTLSRVLQREPDWGGLPDGLPMRVQRLLAACLQKAPKDRLRDVGDIRLALDGAFETGDPATTAAGPRPLAPWQRPIGAALVAAALVATGGGLTWVLTRAQRTRPTSIGASAEPSRHVNLLLPSDAPLVFVGEASLGIGQTALALSPDGQRLVYVGKAGDSTELYSRSLQEPGVHPLAGTEGAYAPCFSPDGQWVAFFAGQRLRRVPVDGGLASDVVEANSTYGCSWSTDGRIVVVTNDGSRFGIVDPGAGRLTTAATFDLRDGLLAHPFWLPDSEWVLATCYVPYHLCAVSTRTGERRHLMLGRASQATAEVDAFVRGSNARYVAPGFLVYSAPADNVVMAVRFDPARLAVLGQPVALLRGVRRESSQGALQMAATVNGDVVFAAGANEDVSSLVWAGRRGVVDPLPFGPRTYGSFFLSRDGHRIAAKIYPQVGPSELWFLDTSTGDQRRWVDEGLVGEREVWPGPWMPDSNDVLVFAVGAPSSIFVVDSVRASGGRTVLTRPETIAPESVGTGGNLLLRVDRGSRPRYMALSTLTGLSTLPGTLDQVLSPLVPSTARQQLADLSPDMKWFAFTTDESGPYEVWASRLPPRSAPIRVSNDGGELPRWSPRGDGLYYRNGQRWYWVALTGSDERPFAAPEFVLEGDYLNISGPEYAVSPDGQRLLLLRGSGERTTTTLDLLTNWRGELEREIPAVK